MYGLGCGVIYPSAWLSYIHFLLYHYYPENCGGHYEQGNYNDQEQKVIYRTCANQAFWSIHN